jgi:hypothetical protein
MYHVEFRTPDLSEPIHESFDSLELAHATIEELAFGEPNATIYITDDADVLIETIVCRLV